VTVKDNRDDGLPNILGPLCLVLSHGTSVWIESKTEARPDQPNVPWMQGRSRRFLLEN
jgi:hypothetical protein